MLIQFDKLSFVEMKSRKELGPINKKRGRAGNPLCPKNEAVQIFPFRFSTIFPDRK